MGGVGRGCLDLEGWQDAACAREGGGGVGAFNHVTGEEGCQEQPRKSEGA